MSGSRVSMVLRLQEWWGIVSPNLTYIGLWISLAVLMVIYPFIEMLFGSVVFTVIFSMILLLAAMTVPGGRRLKIVALLLLLASIAARLAFQLTGEEELELVSFLFASIGFAWVTLFLFRSLFKTREVTSTILWQAISVYLLIGLTWASVFAFMETMVPGSFEDTALPGTAMSFPVLVYYSFVTMATLGYGDIVPITQEARGLAIMEVLTGVLYMAILISRLVGTWKPKKKYSV